MTQPYVWAPVQPGQVADDGAINALGAAVTSHDTSIIALQANGMAYRASSTLATSAAVVTFTGIPTTLRRIQVFWRVRSDQVAQFDVLHMLINNDTAAHYNYEFTQGNGAGAPLSAAGTGTTFGRIGYYVCNSATVGVFGTGVVWINGWNSPGAGFSLGWTYTAQAQTSSQLNDVGGGNYNQAGPYTRLDFAPSAGLFLAGTDFQIEGW